MAKTSAVLSDDINPELAMALATGDVDFLDFGCSKGVSYKFVQEKLGGKRGIGLDIDPAKIEISRQEGIEAYVQDVTKLALVGNSVRMVMISHFLEHLPSHATAARALLSAFAAARSYVIVRHPYFDANPQLFRLGLKLYSADWSGHTNLMTSNDVWRALRHPIEKGRATVAMFGRGPLRSSRAAEIVPLSAPNNTRRATLKPGLGEKPDVRFDFPMFKEFVAIVVKRRPDGRQSVAWEEIAERLSLDAPFALFGADDAPAVSRTDAAANNPADLEVAV